MVVVSKTDISKKIPNYFKFVKKMNLNVKSFLSSQNIFHDLKGPKVKYNLYYRKLSESTWEKMATTDHQKEEKKTQIDWEGARIVKTEQD